MNRVGFDITDKRIWIVIISVIIVLTITIFTGISLSKTKTVETVVEDKEEIVEETVEEAEEYIDLETLENTEENTEKEAIKEEKKDTNNNTSKKQTTNNNNTNPYYIKVNYGAQVVTIYGKDEEGNYEVPVKAMVCSTGVATPTSGVYKIPARWEWLGLQGDVYGHYATQIKGNILFHSVPYLRKGDKASLEYWEYDKLGTYASAGCVRLTVRDAQWIFNNCAKGTCVEFYSSSNPGPLGKPTAKKISSYPEPVRNWDPTDPDSSNPWRTYKQEIKSTNDTNNDTKTNIQNDIQLEQKPVTEPKEDTKLEENKPENKDEQNKEEDKTQNEQEETKPADKEEQEDKDEKEDVPKGTDDSDTNVQKSTAL